MARAISLNCSINDTFFSAILEGQQDSATYLRDVVEERLLLRRLLQFGIEQLHLEVVLGPSDDLLVLKVDVLEQDLDDHLPDLVVVSSDELKVSSRVIGCLHVRIRLRQTWSIWRSSLSRCSG